MSLKPISKLEDIHTYLYAAMQLEHATIPTYLTALYSIHPGTNSEACQVIRVVAVEEMLHLTLAANILNAVGGTVDLTKEDFVPDFPTYLPDGETDFQVSREKFSLNAINTFLTIERPATNRPSDMVETGHGLIKRQDARVHFLPKHEGDDGEELHFYSIGEFYKAIEIGLEELCSKTSEADVFTGDPAKQITSEYYYSGGGEIIPVTDLDSAKKAIQLISEQGEGFEGKILDFEKEISHYYRFEQLKLGRFYLPGDKSGEPTGEAIDVDWDAVYPVKTNVKVADLPEGSELRAAAESFNDEYKRFLLRLTEAFGGKPDIFIEAVGTMFHLKDKILQLIRNPIPDGNGEHAAPTFEIH